MRFALRCAYVQSGIENARVAFDTPHTEKPGETRHFLDISVRPDEAAQYIPGEWYHVDLSLASHT